MEALPGRQNSATEGSEIFLINCPSVRYINPSVKDGLRKREWFECDSDSATMMPWLPKIMLLILQVFESIVRPRMMDLLNGLTCTKWEKSCSLAVWTEATLIGLPSFRKVQSPKQTAQQSSRERTTKRPALFSCGWETHLKIGDDALFTRRLAKHCEDFI